MKTAILLLALGAQAPDGRDGWRTLAGSSADGAPFLLLSGRMHYVPRDKADIASSGWGSGKWDTGYLSSIGDISVIRDERI